MEKCMESLIFLCLFVKFRQIFKRLALNQLHPFPVILYVWFNL